MEPQGPGGPKLYALLTQEFAAQASSAIEIVELSTKTQVGAFSVGSRTVTSLAVAAGGARLYVPDVGRSEVAVYGSFGDQEGAVELDSPPSDCVLSRSGDVLYVSTQEGLVAIDTGANKVAAAVTTGADRLVGVAVSPDDKRVGAVAVGPSPENYGYDPGLYLFDAETLTPTRVEIADPDAPEGAAVLPNDVVFADTDRAILWDANCDSFYQVDVATAEQDLAWTVRLGRDAGSSANFDNVLVYSRVAKRAYALKEFDGWEGWPGLLAILDPRAPEAHTVGGFAAQPFVLALRPDERKLYVSAIARFRGGGADTLDEYDVEADAFERGIYTFQHEDMSVRDMQVL
jgi:DNA-binding beta-propeller fold protein YncE